jgi:hypothetical protein
LSESKDKQRLNFGYRLLSKERKDDGQKDTQDDAGDDREVKGEFFLSDDDVAWKLSDPRNLVTHHEKNANPRNHGTENNEYLPKITKPKHMKTSYLTLMNNSNSLFTLLRRKPRSLRPWMNAERVPFEALKERSRVCFGGFRPLKHVEGQRALARGAPLYLVANLFPLS